MVNRCRHHPLPRMAVSSHSARQINPVHEPSAEKSVEGIGIVRQNNLGHLRDRIAHGPLLCQSCIVVSRHDLSDKRANLARSIGVEIAGRQPVDSSIRMSLAPTLARQVISHRSMRHRSMTQFTGEVKRNLFRGRARNRETDRIPIAPLRKMWTCASIAEIAEVAKVSFGGRYLLC